MIGGIVIEKIVVGARVWINCRENGSSNECAIYVENDRNARRVDLEDTVWWQDTMAMWTPRHSLKAHPGGDHDIVLTKIGSSGAQRPGTLFTTATGTCDVCQQQTDGGLINLGLRQGRPFMVCAPCASFAVRQRDAALDALLFVKKHAVFPMGVLHEFKPGSPWDIVDTALEMEPHETR